MTVINYIGISPRKTSQRAQLQADMDAYLAAGGTIEHLPMGSATVPETVQEALREALHMAERASGRIAAKQTPTKGKTRAERNRAEFTANVAAKVAAKVTRRKARREQMTMLPKVRYCPPSAKIKPWHRG